MTDYLVSRNKQLEEKLVDLENKKKELEDQYVTTHESKAYKFWRKIQSCKKTLKNPHFLNHKDVNF